MSGVSQLGFAQQMRSKNPQSISLEVQPGYVYHASPIQHLHVLRPHESTHEKKWVYASPDPVIAASFLIKEGDFHISRLVDSNGKFCLVERYEGAFSRYKKACGSIYKLSSSGFLSDQTAWEPEVVYPGQVAVIEEILIRDDYTFLKELESASRIKLYYYPSRPSCIPADDSDLINEAVRWTKIWPETKDDFLRLHPYLKIRFDLALALEE